MGYANRCFPGIYRRSTSGGLAITAAAFNVYRRFKPPLKRHTAPTVQPLLFFDIAHPSPWVLSLPPSLVFNTGSQDLPRCVACVAFITRSQELLRHFWSSYPITAQNLINKAAKALYEFCHKGIDEPLYGRCPEEEEDDESANEYTYDEDASWKVRRAAAKCLVALIVSRHELLSKPYDEILKAC
ncbi:Cullin-associated NEDD8-dissociated protein 1 [Trifolium repens]|nr:Cullin-associated NEDD8-dissociated protein 1 [Trifolium repens]